MDYFTKKNVYTFSFQKVQLLSKKEKRRRKKCIFLCGRPPPHFFQVFPYHLPVFVKDADTKSLADTGQDRPTFRILFIRDYVHGHQIYMAVCFGYLVKSDLSIVHSVQQRTRENSRYQNNTAMLIRSGCSCLVLNRQRCEKISERKCLQGINVVFSIFLFYPYSCIITKLFTEIMVQCIPRPP